VPELKTIQPKALRAAARAMCPANTVRDVVSLVDFARSGTGDTAEVSAAFDRAMRALYAVPGDIDFDPLRSRLKAPIRGEDGAVVTTVLRACRGRLRLLADGAIDTADLAALVGLDDSMIRRMARKGALQRQSTPRGPLRGAEAMSLLRERGVAGFAAAPAPRTEEARA